jgi:hypothetical protein
VDFATSNHVGKMGDNIYTGDQNNIFVISGGAKLNKTTNLNKEPSDAIFVPAAP